MYRLSFREVQNGAFSEWFRVKLGRIQKTLNLNPESFKRNFNGFKKNLTCEKWGQGHLFAGQAGTITSFIFYEALGLGLGLVLGLRVRVRVKLA